MTLSPPKNIWGSQSLTKLKKFIFNPDAKGNSPKIVVIAVKELVATLFFPQ